MSPARPSPERTRARLRAVSNHDEHNAVREEFRPPTAREREILDFLLSVEAVGIVELREQAALARVARWSCGCASFNVVVDRDKAPRSVITTSPAVEAFSTERDDSDKAFDLLLWVQDGWLAGVEIVDYLSRHGEDSPKEIPPRENWGGPQTRQS
jgi:hypothetical protein